MKSIAFAGVFLATVCLAPGYAYAEGDVDAVMKAHIEALGGKDAINAVKTLKRSGTASMGGVFGDMTGTFEEVMVIGSKAYSFLDLGVFSEKQGWNGEVGWKVNSMEGSSTLSGDELGALQSQLTVDPLATAWFDGGKDAITKLPDETIEDKTYTVLTVTGAETIRYYLDPETHHLARLVVPFTDPTLGATTVVITFHEFETNSGVAMAGKSLVDVADGTIILNYDYSETVINPEIDETIFEKP